MRDGIQKQHQLHGLGALLIVFLQVVVQRVAQLLEIDDLNVGSHVDLGVDKVPEQNRLFAQSVLRVQLVEAGDLVLQQRVEPEAVLVVDQAILKDAATFMVPKAKHWLDILQKKQQMMKLN